MISNSSSSIFSKSILFPFLNCSAESSLCFSAVLIIFIISFSSKVEFFSIDLSLILDFKLLNVLTFILFFSFMPLIMSKVIFSSIFIMLPLIL